ncbi:hypothetical protein [Streptomyces sp. CAU 1734]|uniref:recombination directionality factor n=1 Tax=Streptomyces sp. CAU 1734 TaxID=3140360 RepID=UPI003260E0FB
MAVNLRIWETDPDSKPKPRARFADDFVGRFRSGRLVGKAPESLDFWRVTTGDPEVAARIADLMGGTPTEWETEKEDNLEILSDARSVDIIIASSAALDASMKKFGFAGLEHHCDGVVYLTDDDAALVGTPCGCPPDLQARKDRAKSGKGPKPSVDLTFKLAAAPDLGFFRFNSGAWKLVDVVHELYAEIDAFDGPVRATLEIERVEYTTKAGRDVRYNKPVITVRGAYVEADDSPELSLAA